MVSVVLVQNQSDRRKADEKMSSSNRNLYRNGHRGSNHYQRKSILGNLFNIFGSGSSRDRYNNYPGQYPNQPNPNLPNQMTGCSGCNARIPVDARFCPQCGAKLNEALFCMSCGEKLPPNAKFCLKCGEKLNG
jgi:ribosomal protein L40E